MIVRSLKSLVAIHKMFWDFYLIILRVGLPYYEIDHYISSKSFEAKA